jgi:hypothetical protein
LFPCRFFSHVSLSHELDENIIKGHYVLVGLPDGNVALLERSNEGWQSGGRLIRADEDKPWLAE